MFLKSFYCHLYVFGHVIYSVIVQPVSGVQGLYCEHSIYDSALILADAKKTSSFREITGLPAESCHML